MNVAILYGTSTGNTQSIAESISDKLGQDADLINVEEASQDSVESYDFLILGTSTWGLGDLQDDWEGFLSTLQKANLQDKKIALFGLGDADAYADTFVDGMGTIYQAIAGKGCELVGKVPVEEYTFDASTAVVDGQFVGLPLDEDNESDKSDARIEAWVELLKPYVQ